MRDPEVLHAVCSLAAADSALTVEELQFLDGLVKATGLDQSQFRARIGKTRDDDDYRQQQIDTATRDADATMIELISAARETGDLAQGHATMLLWRVATDQLQMSAERFQDLLAGGRSR